MVDCFYIIVIIIYLINALNTNPHIHLPQSGGKLSQSGAYFNRNSILIPMVLESDVQQAQLFMSVRSSHNVLLALWGTFTS